MTALAGGVAYPANKFDVEGKTISGRIIDLEDLPLLDYNTKQPKFWKNGKPMEQTRVSLEQTPGDEESRCSVYISGMRLERAVKEAFKAAGRTDLVVGDDLSITFTGWESTPQGPQAKTYTARYAAN